MTDLGLLSPPEPMRVGLDGAFSGALDEYRKTAADMRGIYRDAAAWERWTAAVGADFVAYSVESLTVGDGPGGIIVGTSTLSPGKVGDEFSITRGHLHRKADRAELYFGISGRGLLLLESVSGECEIREISAGIVVAVPGHWIHRSVNTGSEPLVTLFSYAADAGQDYDLISRAGGMSHLVVEDSAGGWRLERNPDHIGYEVE